MLKSELNRYIHDRRTWFFSILIILIPLLDFIQTLIVQQQFSDFSDPKHLINPIVASFLAGSQAEHYGQIVLIWFMPILLLGLCADRAIRDHKTNYDVMQITRFGRKRYYLVNLVVNGLLACTTMAIGLVLNDLLAVAVFHGGRDFLSDALENPSLMSAEESWQYDHTVLTMVIVTLSTILLVTIFAMACYALSLIFTNYYAVYTIAFVAWFAQIAAKYSITYLMQPLIEYGLRYQIPAALIFIVISGIIIGLGYWRTMRHVDWL